MGSRGTHREVKATRTDTITNTKEKERERERERTCTLIDEAIPQDMIVTQKEAKKKLNTQVYVYTYTNAENEMYDYTGTT